MDYMELDALCLKKADKLTHPGMGGLIDPHGMQGMGVNKMCGLLWP